MNGFSALGLLLSAGVLAGRPCHGYREPTAEPSVPARADARAPGREPRAVRISDFKFAPAELSVSVGDTITWINLDTFAHTTTADSGAWGSSELATGQRFVFVARRSGRFPYHCAAHPVMRAIIVVPE